MQLEVTGRHVPITEEMRELTEQRLERLERQVPEGTFCRVTLTEQHNPAIPEHFHVEATLQMPGATIHAEADSRELGPCLGHVVDELQRQVHRHLDKARLGRRAGGETIRRADEV
ncbi:unannotated protein [freshwater metagenome]|uniref:Unannotated protein n=1 Tax=freshwater metagenome TaxID=449393 RepID=A0A6J7DAH9_9ZZZZ|nr:ribosome-associated translation inhibitor RaiA [Actinomycetota bacterium]